MLKQEWEIDNPLNDQLEDQMEVLNEYSEIMKKSVGQYAELTKKMQETATAALEQQLAATKEYMEWSMKTNAKLMEDFVNFSTSARETMTENMEIAKRTYEETVAATKKSI
jgi:hypothetical protein